MSLEQQETSKSRDEWTITELLENASEGLSLQGVFISSCPEKMLHKRKQLLNVPVNSTWSSPNKDLEESFKTFDLSSHEHQTTKCIEQLGLGFSGQFLTACQFTGESSGTSVRIETTESYTCQWKMSVVKTACCELSKRDLVLCNSAKHDLHKLEDTLLYQQQCDMHLQCKQFLERYGSHISTKITFGGIYFMKAKTIHFSEDQRAAIQQTNKFMLKSDFAGLLDCSRNTLSSKEDTDERKFEIHEKNTNLRIKTIGGPTEAASLKYWKEGLLTQNRTWQLIDRGPTNDHIPVWEIILQNHKKDITQCELLAEALKNCWKTEAGIMMAQKKIQNLVTRLKEWNKAGKIEFIQNCVNYISECNALKLEIEMWDVETESMWYREFLCKSEVQSFLTSLLHCTENDTLPFESKSHLIQGISQVLEPIQILAVKSFPNISEIQGCIKQCNEIVDQVTFNSFDEAIEHIKELGVLGEKYFEIDQNSIYAKEVMCHNLGKALFGLQQYLKDHGTKYSALAVDAYLYPISYKSNGTFTKRILSVEEWRFLSAQLKQLQSFVAQLASMDTQQQQALLLYTALSYPDGIQEKEPDKKRELLRILCDDLTDEICQPINQVVMGENGELLPELANIRMNLYFLSMHSADWPQERMQFENEILHLLGLERYRQTRLSLNKIMEITTDVLEDKKPTELKDLPWYFLRKLMASDTKAMHMKCQDDEVEEVTNADEYNFNEIFKDSNKTKASIHPLDVITAVYLFSDLILQQEMLKKMSMCQFAVPLLTPTSTNTCVLNLWAMRSIVKKWRPAVLGSGFKEDSMVTASLPVISFIRVSSCKVSKSKLLNVLLSGSQHHNFFFHYGLECGNTPRKISNGLVELCWYLPSGRENLDVFTEAVTILNLRGDAMDFPAQVQFLREVSSAMFIFVDDIEDRESRFLALLKELPAKQSEQESAKLFLAMNPRNPQSTQEQLIRLAPHLKIGKKQVLTHTNKNEAEFIETLRLLVRDEVKQKYTIEKMAEIARGLAINVDEDDTLCTSARRAAGSIIDSINFKNTTDYKYKKLPLQGKDFYKEWSKLDMEQSRPKNCSIKTTLAHYIDELDQKKKEIRQKQLKEGVSMEVTQLMKVLRQETGDERNIFLQSLKLELDVKSRETLSGLRESYKQLCENSKAQQLELTKLDKNISDSSLGLEHFMRELGQLYEAQNACLKGECSDLPGLAADLLLNRYPLEIIDGDVSNVPLTWVTAVLHELQHKIGPRNKIFVVTVLGVQGTGKSTLLNTMFGLQLAVSNGRCTRGAFLQLIKISDDLKKSLECDYIMVIDTEGLKAPELANLKDSYEHDNELATFVVGLSDITLINLSMENLTEMKDVLQIVVHAFIRMKDMGKKPNCHFVHQNAGDVSARDLNIRDQKKLLDHLNDMTNAAAKMENKEETYSKFSDVVEYDPNKNNWYIAGLWHGNPPMAHVNTGYNDSVLKLKTNILDCIKKGQKPLAITDFIQQIRTTWAAVRNENFIFSFQNTLVADAYNELSKAYSSWSWEGKKEFSAWIESAENQVRNCKSDLWILQSTLKKNATTLAQDMETKVIQKLENYFSSGSENIYLVEKFKTEFILSSEAIIQQLLRNAISQCELSVLRQKELHKFYKVQETYKNEIEAEVNKLLQSCRQQETRPNEEQLEEAFEQMWDKTVSSFEPIPHTGVDIIVDMEKCIGKLYPESTSLNIKLRKGLPKGKCDNENFEVNNDHIVINLQSKVMSYLKTGQELQKAQVFTDQVIRNCETHINKMVSKEIDYIENHCEEVLRKIDTEIQGLTSKQYVFNDYYQSDIKLHICAYAVEKFQEKHDKFLEETDPKTKLKRKKDEYFQIFKDLYYGERQKTKKRAEQFVHSCVKPELYSIIYKKLGTQIVTDMQENSLLSEFLLPLRFQVVLFVHLKRTNKFHDYYFYVTDYDAYTEDWLKEQVVIHCNKINENQKTLSRLADNILNDITEKLTNAVKRIQNLQTCNSAQDFLKEFRSEMNAVMVIPQENIDVVQFKCSESAQYFSNDVLRSIGDIIPQLKEEIKNWKMNEVLSKLTTSPQKELFSSVHPCRQKCPLCGAPCESLGTNHEHQATSHRPTGFSCYTKSDCSSLLLELLNSFKRPKDHRLSPDICTSLVASDAVFKNAETKFKYTSCKQYKNVYKSWQIPKDLSSTASSYWKWVFYRFSDQFAKIYEVMPAEIIESWDIPWKTVEKDLENMFHIKMDDLYKALGVPLEN